MSVHRTREQTNNDPEILSYTLKKFLRWSGLKKASELELAEERDV